MDICQIGYDICEFDSFRGLGIDIIDILIIEIDLLYGWAVLERRPNHVNKRVVADINFWQFLEPWHGRWYEYEIFIASCTDNIYDLENERWLLGDMIGHVGIYGSRVAEGLSAFNVGLVFLVCRTDSELNHRKHMGVQEGIYDSNKDFEYQIWFSVVFCNRRK